MELIDTVGFGDNRDAPIPLEAYSTLLENISKNGLNLAIILIPVVDTRFDKEAIAETLSILGEGSESTIVIVFNIQFKALD